jgi:hypothetical protein
MNDFCGYDARPAHADDGLQGSVALMLHHRNNIEVYAQFVAQILVFRQSGTNPESLHRALRVKSARSGGGQAGELNRHWMPENRPSLAFL